jgi:hypothetical protein
MLERLFNSPTAAIGFIFFVIILFAFYMMNRERAHVQRLKGPRRFEPQWRTRGGSRRTRRRRRGSGQFKPDWNRRSLPADPDKPDNDAPPDPTAPPNAPATSDPPDPSNPPATPGASG